MSLTVHELALRLARQIGVSSFDPSDASNAPDMYSGSVLNPGDLGYIVASINGALQEVWPFIGEAGSSVPSITVASVGITSDPGTPVPFPGAWVESVLWPLALQRMLTHPAFQPDSSKPEILRQAGVAWKLLSGLATQPVPEAIQLEFVFT